MKRPLLRRFTWMLGALPLSLLWCQADGQAQQAVPAQSAAAATGKSIAPIDLTGQWVALITQDWRFRMMTGPKGDAIGIPLNPEGRRVASQWDPDQAQSPAELCKPYGAPALFRVPGRLQISWADDDTLKIETDAGTQTRLLHFNGSKPADTAPSLQGYSLASWEGMSEAPKARQTIAIQPQRAPPQGYLKATTTDLTAGYLRSNGIPYSANATLEEYFALVREEDGEMYFVVQSIVTDPQYLAQPFVVSTPFKKQPDNSGWNPTPCGAPR